MAHRGRGEHEAAHPVHLTLRARAGVPSLRAPRVFAAVLEAIREASGAAFRVLHFSVQNDHVEFLVEAHDVGALSAGARGVSIRLARAINRACERRGPIWGDRYHTRALTTPLEVRKALVYVLMSFRKHRPADPRPFDPCSSAAWFDGWKSPPPPSFDPAPTARPRTRLAATDWRRHGLLGSDEIPAEPGSTP